MWGIVADLVVQLGGEIKKEHMVTGVNVCGNRITEVSVKHNDKIMSVSGDYVFSTTDVKSLIGGISGDPPPSNVIEVANGLEYRGFITVGLLVDKLLLTNKNHQRINDNWIYIQEPDVKLGRLQIFNNWSPWLVNDENKVWIGLEYFANVGDELWIKSDDDFIGHSNSLKLWTFSPDTLVLVNYPNG